MYMKKIYEKIKAKAYSDISEMSDDVNLMFDNCVAYNNPISPYGKVWSYESYAFFIAVTPLFYLKSL